MITNKETPDSEDAILNNLNPLVKRWFFSKFKEFSLPQKFGVLEIHNRNNILISAPTGATKTLTAFLSILNELVNLAEGGNLENHVYAVYISPLKALNNDIAKNLQEPLAEIEALSGKSLGIRVGVRTGDTTAYEKSKMLDKPPHILVTTPESLAIMLSTKKFIDHLKDVWWTVIDEIHALAENKRGTHLSISLERLNRLSNFCRIGLSATIAPLEEIAQYLVGAERDCTIVNIQFLKDLDLKVLSPVPDLINITYDELQNKTYELIDELIQSHKTTLIFTNTRAGTEKVVHHLKEKYPQNYTENIGAHHGSLSKTHRLNIEERLRKGELKVVVCSTSLELGIDIGFIDLVILLGSPKAVSRALQRVGRSGHQLHSVTKGRFIVMDRDDLLECSLMLKAAVEKKIDRIHIPTNALDVLAQQIYGICIEESQNIKEVYNMIKKSYCYKNLTYDDYLQIIDYLSGKFVSLEDRYIFAKIWIDDATGMMGKRGTMARVLYMTNIGTIPEEAMIHVKMGDAHIGMIDEAFLGRMKKGDIFVLGGSVYQFKHAAGTVAQVAPALGRRPTVPSWYSEMLPLSFDLAMEIQKFRRYMEEKFIYRKSKQEILTFINEYLHVDDNSAKAIFDYFSEQFDYAEIPHDKKILIEHYHELDKHYIIFHTLFGRRVNDVLSRALAYAIFRQQHRDVEIGISDNGFYLASNEKIQVLRAFKLLKSEELRKVLELAIEKTEILKRRFRHCAARALMILRTYKGQTKRVGKQQVSSMILWSALKRINENFSIIREAKREVLEDLMDIENAVKVVKWTEDNDVIVKEISTTIPSPFAFQLILQGYVDVMKMEDKIEFARRMHNLVMAKIGMKVKAVTFS